MRLSIRYVPDFYYKRIQFYDDHSSYMKSVSDNFLKENKSLAGGTTFPSENAIWYLNGIQEDEVDQILHNDPFFKAGLVESWEIKEMQIFGRTSVEGLASMYEYTCI